MRKDYRPGEGPARGIVFGLAFSLVIVAAVGIVGVLVAAVV